MEGTGDIQPAFVDAEGLHQIGVFPVDPVDTAGIVPVLVVVCGEEDQVGTFLPGLPDGFGGFDAKGLGRFVLGQDNAVAAFRVAADRHRKVAQLRVVQQLHRGVKTVQIAVEDDAVQSVPLLSLMCLHYNPHTPKSQTDVLSQNPRLSRGLE